MTIRKVSFWIVFALFVFLLHPAALVATKDNGQFLPEIYALRLLAEQGYTGIAPVMVINYAEAVRIVTAEGVKDVEALAVFSEKSENLPLRGFRIVHDDGSMGPTIYVISDSLVYQMAKKGHERSLLLVASIILHEDAHSHGANESEALEVEVKFLTKQLLRVSSEERPYLARLINYIQRLAKKARVAGDDKR